MIKNSIKQREAAENELLRQEFASGGAENVSYDFFKTMVSLALVALGGVLGLSEGVYGAKIDLARSMIASVPIALSGVVALQCQCDIVQIMRGRKQPTVWLRYGYNLVPALFGIGLGAFIAMIAGVF